MPNYPSTVHSIRRNTTPYKRQEHQEEQTRKSFSNNGNGRGREGMERSEMPYLHGPNTHILYSCSILPTIRVAALKCATTHNSHLSNYLHKKFLTSTETALFSSPLCRRKISEWEVVEEPAMSLWILYPGVVLLGLAKFMGLMRS